MHSVHPHACGERHTFTVSEVIVDGSSPRMWGTHLNRKFRAANHRFIPTHVGNACYCPKNPYHVAVHPHACGERPESLMV